MNRRELANGQRLEQPGEQDAQPPFWNFQDGSTMDGHWFPDITASDVPGWAYDIEHAPVVWRRVGKKAAGRLLDGRTWDQMPAVSTTGRANAPAKQGTGATE